MPGMEMTPNGGMMMDPNAVGEGALSGGRPAKGTPLYCMLARGALGGPGCLQHGFCLVYAVLSRVRVGHRVGHHTGPVGASVDVACLRLTVHWRPDAQARQAARYGWGCAYA